MALIHVVWITSWMTLWMCMYCSGSTQGTEYPELSSSNVNTTEARAQISTAAVTHCRNGSIPYCGELDTRGPHCMDCLHYLWQEIGCKPEGLMGPNSPVNLNFWNGETVQGVKTSMEFYEGLSGACFDPAKPATQAQNATSIEGSTAVDSASESATGLVTPTEPKPVTPGSTDGLFLDSPGQSGTANSEQGTQSYQADRSEANVAPQEMATAERIDGPVIGASADSSYAAGTPSVGTSIPQVTVEPPSGGYPDFVTSSSSGDRTESKPLAVSAKVEEEGNRTTGQAHTGTAATAEAVSTSASQQRGIPRVLLYAVLAVIALVLIMISVAVYCEYTRKRKRENKNDRQPQASLQNTSDETGAEAGSQTELHTSGSFRGKHRESIPIKNLSPIKAGNTETPKDNVV